MTTTTVSSRARLAATLLALGATGCPRGAPVSQRAEASTGAPSPADLALLLQHTPPVPRDLRIAIDPGARAWESGPDVWAIETWITLSNSGTAPIDVDPHLLRFRDQTHVLNANARPGSSMERATLAPGGSLRFEVIAAPIIPSAHGRPTTLRVDYGYLGAQTPEVTAPVALARAAGLVASFRDASAAARVGRPAVGTGPPQFAWQVRLQVEFQNPTSEAIRRPYGQLAATREDGTACYWGDAAGVSGASDWVAPGARTTGQVVLMFPDAPTPPQRVTLTYGAGGAPQTLAVAPAP